MPIGKLLRGLTLSQWASPAGSHACMAVIIATTPRQPYAPWRDRSWQLFRVSDFRESAVFITLITIFHCAILELLSAPIHRGEPVIYGCVGTRLICERRPCYRRLSKIASGLIPLTDDREETINPAQDRQWGNSGRFLHGRLLFC